jgi:dimethylhistidine N-methyltransferase
MRSGNLQASDSQGRCNIRYQKQNRLGLYDFEPQSKTFRDEALQGLQDARKELPSKYFYDDVGSQLFEHICELDEYYLTRTELSIMQQYKAEMASLIGPNCLLIEYGSGSSIKIRKLLDALQAPAGYVAIDIAKDQLLRSAASLRATYPTLEVLPVCADYTSDFELPPPAKSVSRKIAYFPGSTIGNFDREPAKNFLRKIAKTCKGGGLLIGVDLKKDFNILHRAYNDRQGVTARFNLHLLERMNQELDADFQLDQFSHYAFYNPGQSRVEMHLVSLANQIVHIGGCKIPFKLGESIWTESSYKYTLAEFAQLAAMTGFAVERVWTDSQQLFSVQYLRVID